MDDDVVLGSLADDPCCESCNHEVIVARGMSSMVSGLKQPGMELNRQVGELKKSRSRDLQAIITTLKDENKKLQDENKKLQDEIKRKEEYRRLYVVWDDSA